MTLYLNITEEGPAGELFKASQVTSALNDESELFFREDFSQASSHGLMPIKKAPTSVKDVYVHEGVKFVELKCQVRSADVQVEWVRNNRPIDKASTKYEMISRGCDRILIIRNPNKSDNGDYICQTGSQKVTHLNKIYMSMSKLVCLLLSYSVICYFLIQYWML